MITITVVFLARWILNLEIVKGLFRWTWLRLRRPPFAFLELAPPSPDWRGFAASLDSFAHLFRVLAW